MAITMYQAFGSQIFPVNVAKCTAKSVWVLRKKLSIGASVDDSEVAATKCARVSPHSGFHDTWEEAKAQLLKEAEERVLCARRELQQAQAFHGNVKGLKPPAP